jgi:hypothetical protein
MKTTRLPGAARGAALVVGLVLLLILTLLAISGMNTATTELVMAGNEMYQENAFQAAETGIERTMATATFNPDLLPPADPPVVTLSNGATWRGRGAAARLSPPPPGTPSANQCRALRHPEHRHFERNATSTHTEGLFLVVPGAAARRSRRGDTNDPYSPAPHRSVSRRLLAANAHATLSIVEQAVETSTFSISLPDRSGGSIAVMPCATCKPCCCRSQRAQSSRRPHSGFVCGIRGAGPRQHGSRPRRFYDGKERTITRLIISDTRGRRAAAAIIRSCTH